MTEPAPSRDAALFLQLVIGLRHAGMIALGKLVNPITKEAAVDLDAARETIDTLAALETRTRGNLPSDEARFVRQALTDLRLNYLEERKRAGAPSPAADPDAP